MKIRNGYMLRKIADQTYLLPYGQNIAEHRRGIRLNESGVLLWNALQKSTCEDALLSILMQHYESDDSDIPLLRSDIHFFLKQLVSLGILLEDHPKETSVAAFYFKIGTLILSIHSPKELIHPSFFDFSCESSKADQQIHIISDQLFQPDIETLLIRTSEITICSNKTHYIFLYPDSFGLQGWLLTKDGSQADFYCNHPFHKNLAENLFHSIRFAFLVQAQQKGLFALHSASILYQDKAWLFAGNSGTGKSTHTALWNSLFQTPLLNGDLNLIGIECGKPVIYGIPWCGTSGIYTTQTYSLAGITFLKQHQSDELIPITEDEKQLFIMQRLISPAWTSDMLCRNLDFAEELVKHLNIFRLFCTKYPSAVTTIKQVIDSLFDHD